MSSSKVILVIDDDKKFSFGLVMVLRRAGYQVITAYNGVEGLEVIRDKNPDIILCDIMMPPPNGIQLKKELENDPNARRIPFLFLTARTAPVDRLVGFESGADDYITKPFDVNELLVRVQNVLRRDDYGFQIGTQEVSNDLDKLRSSISTNLCHEMREPLTVILPALEQLIRAKFTESNPEFNTYIERALNSANGLKTLVDELEMLYDIDQGKLNTSRQIIDPDSYLKTPSEQILKIWEKKQQNLQFFINPNAVIYAPSIEFSQVMSYLVDNACKFSPEKGRIAISVQPNGSTGCTIEVLDEGPGIALELREKVFERYYQVSQRDTREFGGLGVGLTIARAYARAWGGDVQILDSQVGCRVRMLLPPYKMN
ncbi:MAG: hybrid sensor histidine kinase/response regulator [Chloroflexi bacterium]|nr:hybrid sensor histidine kinase/response regulator [Chloroflexota bacterium]